MKWLWKRAFLSCFLHAGEPRLLTMWFWFVHKTCQNQLFFSISQCIRMQNSIENLVLPSNVVRIYDLTKLRSVKVKTWLPCAPHTVGVRKGWIQNDFHTHAQANQYTNVTWMDNIMQSQCKLALTLHTHANITVMMCRVHHIPRSPLNRGSRI